ncbi:MAG: hypothetical protein F6K14_11755 [Symploca sp. SIO2C1]|nr:hypothetical protein [Symploca sp. SIO2C1]
MNMFTDLNTALAIAKSNLGVTDTSKDTEITAILNASAGKDSTGTTKYRPYLVAAYFLPLWGAVSRSQLIEGDGAKWLKPTDFAPLITSLLTLQESADCGLKIDECWQTNALRQRLQCGCEAETGNIVTGFLGAGVI